MAKARKAANPSNTRLDPMAFGVAFGVLDALAMFFIAIFGIFGFGLGMTSMMSSIYPGYGPHFIGAAIGLFLGLVAGFVFGYLAAVIYNYLIAKGL
ncbi:hypothetical protein FJZ26_02085 [Candidatus Parvarchaeota archaeon]|nr:hypothetical protein [Candidatus Parvarchaeota archaeon]